MMEKDYKYIPELPEEFKCKVPLPSTVQAFVTNGILREEVTIDGGVSITNKPENGFIYQVEEGSCCKESLQVISFRDSQNTNDIYIENELYFRKGSDSSLLLCTHTLSMDKFTTEEVVNIEVEEKAKVNIVVMQNEHNASTHRVTFRLNVAAGAYIKINVVTLHGELLENDFDVKLLGEKSVCDLNGLYLVDGKQKVVTKVNMNHLVPNCSSSQLFKGILDDNSIAEFTGRIVVAPDAQKTEAFQANHNFLISPSAKAYARPQLEIYADDVKCSHGATSGVRDQEALFYMRSRGIGENEAKLLQQLAFTYDVLEKIGNEQLRKRLYDLVESRLRGEFNHCTNCSMNCC